MQIDDGEQELGVGFGGGRVLEMDPLLQGAEVVAQMWHAGGLDAGEDDFLFVSLVAAAAAAAVPLWL